MKLKKCLSSQLPGQIPTKNIKKLVFRMIKCAFLKEKLNTIDTVYEKHIFYHSQDQFLWEFDVAEFEITGGI